MVRPDDTVVYMTIAGLILIGSLALAGILWLCDFLDDLDAQEAFEALADDLKDRLDRASEG
jgi:hypothetical protein